MGGGLGQRDGDADPAVVRQAGDRHRENLAEHIRDRFPRPAVWAYWVQAEIIAMATDLAEFIGAAIGFKLLLGVSLLQGAVLTGIATF